MDRVRFFKICWNNKVNRYSAYYSSQKGEIKMESKKQPRVIKTILAVLAVICIIQGYIIYTTVYQDKEDSNAINNVSELSFGLMSNYKKNQQQDYNLFNQYFNDQFFTRHNDPFAEIDRLHKQMQDLMKNTYQSTFNHNWDSWFNQKFSFKDNTMSQMGIKFTIDEKDFHYRIIIEIPNLKNNQVNVDIKKHHININGQFSQIQEHKNSFGDVVSKSEVHQSLSKMIPIPGDADYQKATIDKETDKIIITLPKKGSI
jgi:HSP20 family molecular chaperone IbpA